MRCDTEQVIGFEDEILPKASPLADALVGGRLSAVVLLLGAGLLYWEDASRGPNGCRGGRRQADGRRRQLEASRS